jgi:hypothetical protein
MALAVGSNEPCLAAAVYYKRYGMCQSEFLETQFLFRIMRLILVIILPRVAASSICRSAIVPEHSHKFRQDQTAAQEVSCRWQQGQHMFG